MHRSHNLCFRFCSFLFNNSAIYLFVQARPLYWKHETFILPLIGSSSDAAWCLQSQACAIRPYLRYHMHLDLPFWPRIRSCFLQLLLITRTHSINISIHTYPTLHGQFSESSYGGHNSLNCLTNRFATISSSMFSEISPPSKRCCPCPSGVIRRTQNTDATEEEDVRRSLHV